jgi:hypothetical protein
MERGSLAETGEVKFPLSHERTRPRRPSGRRRLSRNGMPIAVRPGALESFPGPLQDQTATESAASVNSLIWSKFM